MVGEDLACEVESSGGRVTRCMAEGNVPKRINVSHGYMNAKL